MENETVESVESTESTESTEVETVETEAQESTETESHEATLDVYNDQSENDFKVPMDKEDDFDFDNMTDEQLDTLISELEKGEDKDEENDSKDEFGLPEKFKDVESLVKSYNNLESKVGNFKGAPESYEIDGVDMETDVMVELSKTAKELNMSNEGFSAIVNKFNEVQSQTIEANQIIEMQNLGKNAETRISNINSYLDNNLDKATADSIRSLAVTSDAVTAIESLIGSTRPSGPSSTPTQAPAPQDINALLQEKDAYGSLRMETDSEFNSKVMKLMSQQW